MPRSRVSEPRTRRHRARVRSPRVRRLRDALFRSRRPPRQCDRTLIGSSGCRESVACFCRGALLTEAASLEGCKEEVDRSPTRKRRRNSHERPEMRSLVTISSRFRPSSDSPAKAACDYTKRPEVTAASIRCRRSRPADRKAPRSVVRRNRRSGYGPVAFGCCARMSVSARLAAVRGRYSNVTMRVTTRSHTTGPPGGPMPTKAAHLNRIVGVRVDVRVGRLTRAGGIGPVELGGRCGCVRLCARRAASCLHRVRLLR